MYKRQIEYLKDSLLELRLENEVNLDETVIGFIGAGNMAGSIIRGLIGAGKNPESIFVRT